MISNGGLPPQEQTEKSPYENLHVMGLKTQQNLKKWKNQNTHAKEKSLYENKKLK